MPARWLRAIGGRAAVRTSPGEAAWHFRVQSQVERLISPIRAAVLVTTAAVWLGRPPGPQALSPWAWAVIAAAFMYVPLDFWLVYGRGRPPRWPYVSALADLVLVMGTVAASGLGRSPFLPLLFLGAIAAPLRLGLPAAIATTLAYAGMWLAAAPSAERFAAVYVAMAGAVNIAWTAVVQNDERSHMRDALTGCFTRGYALFQIERLLAEGQLPFAIGMLDLDGFKAVNDRLGHMAGDIVLRESARAIAAHIRMQDLLARYGGDEFLVVWIGMDARDAALAAERVRAGLEAERFPVREAAGELALTLSLGVVAAAGSASAGQLLLAADRALYQAKQQRNHVCLDGGAPDRAMAGASSGPDRDTGRNAEGGGAECTC